MPVVVGELVERPTKLVPALLTSTSTAPKRSAHAATIRSASAAHRDVGGDELAAELLRDPRRLVAVARDEQHPRALGAQQPRGREADAARRAGDDARLAVEPQIHDEVDKLARMRSHTVYRTFTTQQRRQFVRITDDVQAAVTESGVAEGLVLVSAMHITAGVWVNDDEPGILEDALEWLDKLAPPSWKEPANEVARDLSPDPGDYRHHRGGEDNGDAHFKNLLVHHQVVLPITDGRLDLGPWQAVFYCEFDGGRPKRLVIKVLGE